MRSIPQKRPSASSSTKRSELAEALARSRSALAATGLFSCLINILALTGPLFMLQVYDRVLPSHSIPTLVGFAVLAIALFGFQGVLDAVRGRVLLRIGSAVASDISGRVYDIIARAPLTTRDSSNGLQPARDLDQIRSFLASPGPSAMFDLPWMPFYIAVCFLFHPLIGLIALGGALVLVGLTLTTEFVTRSPSKESVGLAAARDSLLDASLRNAEVLHAMGMRSRLAKRFDAVDEDYQRSQRLVADRAVTLGSVSRVMRLIVQSAVLGAGAYLVIIGQATPGIIIASAILTSRALAPVELAIANWKGFVASRGAYHRLKNNLEQIPERAGPLALPAPKKALAIESVSAAPPGLPRIVLQDVSFALKSGDGLGVIGPSASGKSSLARLIVGVWTPVRGKVRIDGAALDQWASDALGPHIGYLPQAVELFDGTVAENICRFEEDPDGDAIIHAAAAAGVHDLIVGLPEGYETRIGTGGSNLSAGQRQRVALARALYRDPFLVVLDEPNSNLDSDGEEALGAAIAGVRARGGIVIVIAHRRSVLASINYVLVLNKGRQQAFGPRDEVLQKVLRPAQPPLKVVPAAARPEGANA